MRLRGSTFRTVADNISAYTLGSSVPLVMKIWFMTNGPRITSWATSSHRGELTTTQGVVVLPWKQHVKNTAGYMYFFLINNHHPTIPPSKHTSVLMILCSRCPANSTGKWNRSGVSRLMVTIRGIYIKIRDVIAFYHLKILYKPEI